MRASPCARRAAALAASSQRAANGDGQRREVSARANPGQGRASRPRERREGPASEADRLRSIKDARQQIGGQRLEKERGKAIPFHMTPGTAAALKDAMVPAHLSTIDAGRAFRVGHMVVDPFRIPHDTSDPVAFRVGVGERWVGVITDLGKPTTLVSQKLASLSVAVLEFNHDVEMLLDGPYAWPVKQRIRSSHGHLSNTQAGQLLEESIGPDLEHLVLAHLSGQNNAPERAMTAAAQALHRAGASKKVAVYLAAQDQPLDPIGIGIRNW